MGSGRQIREIKYFRADVCGSVYICFFIDKKRASLSERLRMQEVIPLSKAGSAYLLRLL